MMKRFFCALMLAAMLLTLCVPALAEPRYPRQTGVTTDAAAVFSHATLEDLSALDRMMDKNDAPRLKVVTVDFLDGAEADAYAEALFTRWDLDDDDLLLLLAVGEDKYAVQAGKDVRRLLSANVLGKLLATWLEEPFLQQDYDGAIAAFVPALVTEVNKACGARISTDGLFGRAGGSLLDSWANRVISIVQEDESDESFFTKEDKKTGFSFIKVVLTVILLMVIFGGKKKKGFPFLKVLAGFGLFKLWKRH